MRGEICWIFLGFLPVWSKGPNEKVRSILSHLFKWRGIRLGERERDLFVRKKHLQNIERERKGKIIVIFVHPPESVFQTAIADSFTVGSG